MMLTEPGESRPGPTFHEYAGRLTAAGQPQQAALAAALPAGLLIGCCAECGSALSGVAVDGVAAFTADVPIDVFLGAQLVGVEAVPVDDLVSGRRRRLSERRWGQPMGMVAYGTKGSGTLSAARSWVAVVGSIDSLLRANLVRSLALTAATIVLLHELARDARPGPVPEPEAGDAPLARSESYR